MKITIKQVSGVIACATLVAGLAACSSEPAPWTRPDESPWGDKHASSEQAAPADEVIMEEPTTVIVEPVAEPEPDMFAAPEMAAPEPITTSSPEDEIMAMDSGAYAVQLTAMNDIASMERYQKKYGLEDLSVVKTDVNGKVVYVLLSLHPDRADANMAAKKLQAKTGSKPWVRSVAGLQKIVVQ